MPDVPPSSPQPAAPRSATSSVSVPADKTAPPRKEPPAPKPRRAKAVSARKAHERALSAHDTSVDDVERAKHEGERLKWLLLLMVTTWPVGLIWGPWWAAYISLGWAILWGVGKYLNFFHRRNARIRLGEAKERLALAEHRLLEAPDPDAV